MLIAYWTHQKKDLETHSSATPEPHRIGRFEKEARTVAFEHVTDGPSAGAAFGVLMETCLRFWHEVPTPEF